jgi:U3 small nucleolar RNA-associated protein 10
LEILARNFGTRFPAKFSECVPAIVSCLKLEETNTQVVSSALICLATLCSELGSGMLPFLPTFFPLLLGVLDSAKQQRDVNSNLLEVAVLSSVEVVIRCIPQFLSPYYSSILCAVLHPAMLDKAFENTQVLARIDSILQLIVRIEARILLPAVIKAYSFALESKSTNVSLL